VSIQGIEYLFFRYSPVKLPTSRYGTILNQALGKFLRLLTEFPSGIISLISIFKSKEISLFK